MKRKAPITSDRTSKRRKISSPTNITTQDDVGEIISPLANITNHGISPRPTQLITKHLQTQRILAQTKKSINLTDDEEHIIYEDDQEYDEIEVGRGKQTNNEYRYENIELDDPFAVTHHDHTQDTNTNQANIDDRFETITEHEIEKDVESENDEIDIQHDQMMDEELEISQTLLRHKRDIDIDDNVNYDENQSMNMSLQIDNDSVISSVFKNINISSIFSASPKTYHDDKEEEMERDEALEDEEKAVELIDEESQETILTYTVTQINDDETLLEIQETPWPQTKTYSLRKTQTTRHKERVHQSPQREDVESELTPITRNLVNKLNKSLAPTTRSRRKAHKRDTVQQREVELEPMARMEEERQKTIERRQRRRRSSQVESERGRTFSLLDRFRKERMEQQDDDNDIDEEEDERRQMILNQSGLSEQWELIEKRRKKKRMKIKATLAKYSAKKKKKRKRVKDVDFTGVRRPTMSQQMAEEYKEKEDGLATYWRTIESKMNNNEFVDDIKIINAENEKDLNISGRRAETPPRIRKHLERRYRKEYENTTGDIVNVGRKKGKRVWFLNEKHDVLNEEQLETFDNDMNNSLISVTDIDELGVEAMEIEDVSDIDEMGVIEDDVMSLPSVHIMDESSLQLSIKSKEEEMDSYSVVSGMLLPSIGSLGSIMEEDEQELIDPFAVDDVAMDVDDSINSNEN